MQREHRLRWDRPTQCPHVTEDVGAPTLLQEASPGLSRKESNLTPNFLALHWWPPKHGPGPQPVTGLLAPPAGQEHQVALLPRGPHPSAGRGRGAPRQHGGVKYPPCFTDAPSPCSSTTFLPWAPPRGSGFCRPLCLCAPARRDLVEKTGCPGRQEKTGWTASARDNPPLTHPPVLPGKGEGPTATAHPPCTQLRARCSSHIKSH